MERIETLNKQVKEDKILLKRCKHENTVMIQINNPKKLNAIDTSMYQRLSVIAQDPKNKIIILRGVGDKSFSCGGDVKSLYKFITQKDEESILKYFVTEFEMDYSYYLMNQIINCSQITIYNGISIGGGLTMSLYSKIRICTQKTLISLPEAKNGLIVPSIQYFAHIRDNLGKYLVMTGGFIKGEDCVRFGLADYCVDQNQLADLQNELEEQENLEDCHQICKKYAKQINLNDIKNYEYIKDTFDFSVDFNTFWLNLNKKAEQNENLQLKKFAQYCIDQINISSKISIRLNYYLMQLSLDPKQTIEQLLVAQANASYNIVNYSADCLEGLKRAVLDKAYTPVWQHDSVFSVSQSDMDLMLNKNEKVEIFQKLIKKYFDNCQIIFQNKKKLYEKSN